VTLRGAEETPSRIEALRMYVSGSAWFAHDAAQRGTLAAGKFADLAVLSKDYLSVPVDAIGGIQSLLTMVGGRLVYADGAFTKFEQRR
jgi:predicted amidohydrolase YtcJ